MMAQRSRIILVYAASLAAAACIFLLIRRLGSSLVGLGAPQAHAPAQATSSDTGNVWMHVVLALFVVLVVARAVGAIFRKLNQPQVMGEVVAGILLGPSFFGWLAPGLASQVLSASVAPHLAVISQLGVVLYMFLVGLELDTDLLRQRTKSSIAISHASMVVPFLLGGVSALWLYPRYATQNVSFTVFALFLGVAMSVTAFPVLARILTDRGLQKSSLGVVALACAAVDDVTAWCLLALLVAVARAEAGNLVSTLAMTLGFISFVLLVAKYGAIWLVRKREEKGRTTRDMFAIVLAALLMAALAAERIGIHGLFGAFLLGTLIPQDSALARDIRDKCEDLVVVLLLPIFFAFTGMRTKIGLLNGTRYWLACVLVIAIAALGKFGGSFLAARLTGSDWREAASLGVLLNTRGLMELIVLNVGLDLGLLPPTLFAMFVIMAIVTTLATAPVLQVLTPSPRAARDLASR
jgi:Kef-type K+ transport system membrane component KefB